MSSTENWRTPCHTAMRLREEFASTGDEGNLSKAETLFREAIQGSPNVWMSHFGLGEVLLLKAARSSQKSGPVFSEGLAEIIRAAELAPNQPEPPLKLASALAPLDIDMADRYYLLALKALESMAKPMYPVRWQSIDHWNFAIPAAQAGHHSISIDAFCWAIELDGIFASEYAPSPPRANAAWQLAVARLGKQGLGCRTVNLPNGGYILISESHVGVDVDLVDKTRKIFDRVALRGGKLLFVDARTPEEIHSVVIHLREVEQVLPAQVRNALESVGLCDGNERTMTEYKVEGEQPEDREIYGDELKELRGLLRRQKGVLHCLQCNSEIQIDLKTIESQIRRNRDIETSFGVGGRVVLTGPNISQGTVCKNCRGIVCGICSHDALVRKVEFRHYLEPLIRKHLLRQLGGDAALLNPRVVEETIEKTLPLILSPGDESTILCLRCKQELLMGIDHITD